MTDEYEYITEHWEEIEAHETPCEAVLEALRSQEERHRELGKIMRLSPDEKGGSRYAAAEGLLRALQVPSLSIRCILDSQQTMRKKAGLGNDISLPTITAIDVIAASYVQAHAREIDNHVVPDQSASGTMGKEDAALLARLIDTMEVPMQQAADREGYGEERFISAACGAVAEAIREEVKIILYGDPDDDGEA